jgi:hypothetical protein
MAKRSSSPSGPLITSCSTATESFLVDGVLPASCTATSPQPANPRQPPPDRTNAHSGTRQNPEIYRRSAQMAGQSLVTRDLLVSVGVVVVGDDGEVERAGG